MGDFFEICFRAFRGLSLLQLFGIAAAISAIHILGIQSALGELAPIMSTPANAAIALGQLAYSYAWALVFVYVGQTFSFVFQELKEGLVARKEKRLRRVIVDDELDMKRLVAQAAQHISLTIAVYAWKFWVFALILYLFGILLDKLSKRLPRISLGIFPEMHQLDDYSGALRYQYRAMRGILLVSVLLGAYLLGAARIASLSGNSEVTISAIGETYSGSIIYRLYDGTILRTEDGDNIFISDAGIVLRER